MAVTSLFFEHTFGEQVQIKLEVAVRICNRFACNFQPSALYP